MNSPRSCSAGRAMDDDSSVDLSFALDLCATALASHRLALEQPRPDAVEAALRELERSVDELGRVARADTSERLGAIGALAAQAKLDYLLVLALLRTTTEYLRFRSTLFGLLNSYDRLGAPAEPPATVLFEGSA